MRFYRIEYTDGKGLYQSEYPLTRINTIWALRVVDRHGDLPTGLEDGLNRHKSGKEWFFGFLSIKDMLYWVKPSELRMLVKRGYRVYRIEATTVQVSENQVIYTKESIKKKVSITSKFR